MKNTQINKKEPKSNNKNTEKNVWLLGITSFFNDIGGEMLAPILPLFLAYLGASGFIIGIVSGLREAISKVLQVFCGYWSDKIDKRKPFIIFGYFFSGLSKIFLAVSTIWPLAVLFSGTERIGKGVREAPRDSLIANSGMSHGKAFAIQKSLDTAGGILGSILVFVLFETLNLKFNTIILIASCVVFISLIPVVFVKDFKSNDFQSDNKKQTMIQDMKQLPKSVWLFIFVSGFFAFANFGYVFLILRAQQNFSDSLIIAAPLLLYILFNLIYAGFSIPFGILADRIGRRRIMMFGYLMFIILSILLAIFINLIVLIICFAFFGLVYAILQSQQKAFVADLTQKELDGTAIGVWNTATGLIAIPSGFISGYLWDINPSYTFAFGAVVCFIGLIIFYFGRKLNWF